MFNKTIIYLLLFIINNSCIFGHKCGADLLNKKLNLKYNITSNRIRKRRLAENYTPINICVDYNIMEDQNIDEDIFEKYKAMFSELVGYFNKIISVQHEDINVLDIRELVTMLRNDKKIVINKISFGQIDKDDSCDLYVFPFVDTNEAILSKNIIAGANPLYLKEEYKDRRPIFGTIVLNKSLISKSDLDYYIKNTLFHEFFHILGFIPDLISQNSFQNDEYIYINSKKVLEKAKIHFGCEDIKGLRMEDSGEKGTVGSHWDARFMQGELMISEDYSEIVMSDMTLAFLEDLGFYQINYYTGGLFKFGKNQGCSFLEKRCLYNSGANTLFSNEFCTKSEEAFCTGSHTAKGKCFLVKYKYDIPENYRYFTEPKAGGKDFADYCPISYPINVDTNNYYYPTNCIYGNREYNDEIIGTNSMCFESSINLGTKKSICYEIECDKTNKAINVKIGDKVVVCSGTKNKMLNPNGLSGTLYCPDYNMVCASTTWCNNIFDCIDRQSEADQDTFLFNTNKDELQEMDNLYLKVNDNLPISDNDGQFLNKKYHFFSMILVFLFFANPFI